MNPSTTQARVVVDELIRGGVRDVVLCPGSRNAPLAFALQDAEAVLFVHDYKAELFEGYGIFDQRVRADDDLCGAAFNASKGFVFGGAFAAADD